MITGDFAVFADQHRFQDDVWGQIILNDLERRVIDTPEFQRLFRTSQLGFVDLVYQSANHTRGAHSIGTCHIANRLMNCLMDNMKRLDGARRYAPITISDAERVLIRLGALLHDISHVPLSHDLERKTHWIPYQPELKLRSCYGHYDKHDDYERNPLLYLLLCDETVSVLARLLRRFSAPFHQLLNGADATRHPHLGEFLALLPKAKELGWDPVRELLPALLFHLLIYEGEHDLKKATHGTREIAVRLQGRQAITTRWGLGPDSLRGDLHELWYQPFRHDVIGNTLSADLIDYLKRDPQHMGMDRHIDLHLLDAYVLVPTIVNGKGRTGHNSTSYQPSQTNAVPERYRCAIDLHDHKRNTARTEGLNDVFRLLDLRHEIHEKAVMHRVVQSANAMLSRALLLLGDDRPQLTDLVGLNRRDHALQGEDTFFQRLLDQCAEPPAGNQRRVKAAREILLKIIDRRVYRPLIMMPGDFAARHFSPSGRKEHNLRTLATLIDSSYYSPFLLFASAAVEKLLQGVFETDDGLCQEIKRIMTDENLARQATDVIPSRVIIWTTPYKQLYKDPGVLVALSQLVAPIHEIPEKAKDSQEDKSVIELIQRSIDNADSKYAGLWKLYVFISDSLYYTGTLTKLKRCASGLKQSDADVEQQLLRLDKAHALLMAAFDAIWNNWSGFCESNSATPDRTNCLQTRINIPGFQLLVERWVAEYRDSPRKPVHSTVDKSHYVHGDPLLEGLGMPPHGAAGHNCRDIRYQLDKPASERWERAKSETGTPANEVVAFLEHAGVRDAEEISELELVGLVDAYDEEVRSKCQAWVNESVGDRLDLSVLKVFWQADFPFSEVGPTPDLRDREPVAAQSLPFTPDPQPVPSSRREIEKWLLAKAEILPRRPRKQLTTDLDVLVTYIQSLSSDDRLAVLGNLQERFRFDSLSEVADIKARQIVNSLQQWLEKRIGMRAAGQDSE